MGQNWKERWGAPTTSLWLKIQSILIIYSSRETALKAYFWLLLFNCYTSFKKWYTGINKFL